jgi:exopolysaccharide biosynthesis polyprenyl glycosylphosphotransferase
MEPDLLDVLKGHVKTHQLYGFPLLILLPKHMPDWEAGIKKFIDIFISLTVIIAGLPVWLFISWLIKLISKGPIIYPQERIGQNGKPFILYKFRTMVPNAEAVTGPVWAGEKDPRITSIGRILRKTRLDEVPQFINVLKGEMSLVGPRPERAFFIEKLKEEIPIYVRRLKMKPGITGWAQVKHHYDTSVEDVKQKILYDMYYFENMSLRLDLKILYLSVGVVLTGKGAHYQYFIYS